MIVLIAIGVALLRSGHHGAQNTSAKAPTRHARLSLVKKTSESYCLIDAADARIWVSIAIRNSGNGAGSVDPWASLSFSDGTDQTENYDNTAPTLSLRIPAHSVRVARFPHSYNRDTETLLRCDGSLDVGAANSYALPVLTH
jgi:hypothetical protein